MALDFDRDGRVRCRGIHDAMLLALKIEKDERIQIETAADTVNLSISLRGVVEFNVSNMCNGSIILDLFCWNVSEVPSNIEIYDNAWNILYSSRYKAEDINYLAKKKMELFPDKFLVHLSCSYGGDLAAICKNIEITSSAYDKVLQILQ